jgi:hypothetical protein
MAVLEADKLIGNPPRLRSYRLTYQIGIFIAWNQIVDRPVLAELQVARKVDPHAITTLDDTVRMPVSF